MWTLKNIASNFSPRFIRVWTALFLINIKGEQEAVFYLLCQFWRMSCRLSEEDDCEQQCFSWSWKKTGRHHCTIPSSFPNHPLAPGSCCVAALSLWAEKNKKPNQLSMESKAQYNCISNPADTMCWLHLYVCIKVSRIRTETHNQKDFQEVDCKICWTYWKQL